MVLVRTSIEILGYTIPNWGVWPAGPACMLERPKPASNLRSRRPPHEYFIKIGPLNNVQNNSFVLVPRLYNNLPCILQNPDRIFEESLTQYAKYIK